MVLKLVFLPYTQPTTIGAVQVGIDYWKRREGVFGGKSARNFGRFDINHLIDCVDHRQEYLDFIGSNYAELIAGLTDGSFCSGKVVCNVGIGKGS